jgi:hypothetical protein
VFLLRPIRQHADDGGEVEVQFGGLPGWLSLVTAGVDRSYVSVSVGEHAGPR